MVDLWTIMKLKITKECYRVKDLWTEGEKSVWTITYVLKFDKLFRLGLRDCCVNSPKFQKAAANVSYFAAVGRHNDGRSLHVLRAEVWWSSSGIISRMVWEAGGDPRHSEEATRVLQTAGEGCWHCSSNHQTQQLHKTQRDSCELEKKWCLVLWEHPALVCWLNTHANFCYGPC